MNKSKNYQKLVHKVNCRQGINTFYITQKVFYFLSITQYDIGYHLALNKKNRKDSKS